MACKFKYGDKVRVGNHTGKIISIIKDHIHYICKVKFDNRFLIPQEMEYEEHLIEMVEEAPASKNAKCTCGITATYGEVPIKNHSDYCDLKNPQKEVQENYNHNDLLEQFESMIGTDDDDDDFGFYMP